MKNITTIKILFIALVFVPFIGNAQNISLVAGNGTGGYSGDAGPATASELSNPGGLVIDTSGNIYVAEYGNNAIRMIAPTGIITTYAGNGTSGYSGDGGPGSAAQLSAPVKLAIDKMDNIYVADHGNNVIRMITPTGIISTVAGSGTLGFYGDGGPATNAMFDYPSGIAIDPVTQDLIIADLQNNRIRRVSSSTGIISTIAGNGIPGAIGDGGPATAAEFNGVFGVNTDLSGNIYVADAYNNKVRKITVSTGIINTIAGTGVAYYNGDDIAATSAQLSNPGGVYVDSVGNVYIGDQFNYRIRKIDTSGIIHTIVGDGVEGFSGDGGPATAAEVAVATEMFYDKNGDFLFTDDINNRVRKITPGSAADTATSVNNVVVLNSVNIFPNPAYDNIFIESNGLDKITQILFVNEVGQVAFEKDLDNTSVNLDINDLVPGLYIVKIKCNDAFVYKEIQKM